jgi:hypothetical protein
VAAFTMTIEADGRGGRLLALLALALTAAGALELVSLMRFEPLGMDFLPLWAAGKIAWTDPGKIYDFAAVTAAQAFMLPPHFAWLRPYPYPPSMLLLLAPLGRLPFWAADAIWSGGALAVFTYAAVRLARRSVGLAALMTVALPASVIAWSAGQAVVLAGGLIVLAVLELERRPRLAGALLGLAAVAKPQAAIMAPIALAACGAVEALVAAGMVATLAVAASALLFGPARWSEWLASLPGFQRVVESVPSLGSAIITPLWAARELGLQGAAAVLVAAAFGLAGAWLTWTLFRRSPDPAHRVGAAAVGSLIAAPYAMCYDAALLAPAAMAIAAAGIGRGRLIVPLLCVGAAYAATTPYLGLPALVLFAVAVMADWRSAPAPAGHASAPAAPSGVTP